MSETTSYKIINPEFEFIFGDKAYTIRKANLNKYAQYQAKIGELKGDPSADSKLIAYCIYLVLKDHDPEITEEKVLDLTPGDVDYFEVLSTLGFMSPKKADQARAIDKLMEQKLKELAQTESTSTESLS